MLEWQNFFLLHLDPNLVSRLLDLSVELCVLADQEFFVVLLFLEVFGDGVLVAGVVELLILIFLEILNIENLLLNLIDVPHH